MAEPLRIYSNPDDIRRLVTQAEYNYDRWPAAHDLPEGLYKCHFPSPQKMHFVQGDQAEKPDIANAGIICLGSIIQVDDQIGALPKKAYEFFSGKNLWPQGVSVLAYESTAQRTLRFHDEYDWIADKSHVSGEMERLAGQIFEAKFIDRRDGLIPPAEFQGFCFLTYSFGNRMAEMVENDLRRRLRERKVPDEAIQKYFDQIKMVSVASSVDVEGLAKNGPSVESIQLINRNDRAVTYWEPFARRFIIPMQDYPYKAINLEQEFGEDGRRRTAIVFAPDSHDSQEDLGHSLHRYMGLMEQLSPQDLQPIADALNIGQAARGERAERRIGKFSSTGRTQLR